MQISIEWFCLFIIMKQIFLILLLFSISSVIIAQDVIVMKDGTTIISKVLEIGTTEIEYKKITNLDGPTYKMLKSDIHAINYENGEKEIFSTIENDNIQSINKNENDLIILKAGTVIPIQIVNSTRASVLKIGDRVAFKVSRDVIVDGVKVIPYGTPVTGIVYKAVRSSFFGTKGKLGIRINNIYTPYGIQIPLDNGDIYVTGTNRTALSVLLFLFVTMPACFICGTRAEIPAGYEIMAKVAENITLNVDGKAFPRNAVITTINGDSASVIVVSIDGTFVTYKLRNEANGKTYTIDKSEIKEVLLEK